MTEQEQGELTLREQAERYATWTPEQWDEYYDDEDRQLFTPLFIVDSDGGDCGSIMPIDEDQVFEVNTRYGTIQWHDDTVQEVKITQAVRDYFHKMALAS